MMLYDSNYDAKFQDIKDDKLERTSRIKSLCISAETIATETVNTLADQDEQLEKINLHLSSIDTTLIDTKQHINRLKGITQRIIDAFRANFYRKTSKIIMHSRKQRNSSVSPIRHRVNSLLRVFFFYTITYNLCFFFLIAAFISKINSKVCWLGRNDYRWTN